ncbi:hypothetical protein Dsin_031750 [Dipteronia sinensis]|uniref:RRM domain-containing protein n=1 Tax=Dipteronia sinensis TaxID=43782 RepID=A0AAD9ZNH2_9ROSI|nr:hypothetical protein Dsin_031750 [Dipteronia sinensis]
MNMRARVRERGSERSSLGGRRDFRGRMFSIFVDNLNPIVDHVGLWGIFKPFGRVRDVFLSSKSSSRKSNFAFIRFESIEEVVKVASLTNEMHVYGWPILSKVASVGWDKRNQPQERQGQHEALKRSTAEGYNFRKGEDIDDEFNQKRSFRAVLVGDYGKFTQQPESIKNKALTMILSSEGFEEEWLNKCAVGSLNGILLKFWSKHLFMKLGGMIGESFWTDEDTNLKKRLDRAKILVSLPQEELVSDKVQVAVGKYSFTVSLNEAEVPVDWLWVEGRLGLMKKASPGFRISFLTWKIPRFEEKMEYVRFQISRHQKGKKVSGQKEKGLVRLRSGSLGKDSKGKAGAAG